MNSTPAMILSCSLTRRRPSMAYSRISRASSLPMFPSGYMSLARPENVLRTPISSRWLKSSFRRNHPSNAWEKSRLRISWQNSERQSEMRAYRPVIRLERILGTSQPGR